jgi:hypothetical protein
MTGTDGRRADIGANAALAVAGHVILAGLWAVPITFGAFGIAWILRGPHSVAARDAAQGSK